MDPPHYFPWASVHRRFPPQVTRPCRLPKRGDQSVLLIDRWRRGIRSCSSASPSPSPRPTPFGSQPSMSQCSPLSRAGTSPFTSLASQRANVPRAITRGHLEVVNGSGTKVTYRSSIDLVTERDQSQCRAPSGHLGQRLPAIGAGCGCTVYTSAVSSRGPAAPKPPTAQSLPSRAAQPCERRGTLRLCHACQQLPRGAAYNSTAHKT